MGWRSGVAHQRLRTIHTEHCSQVAPVGCGGWSGLPRQGAKAGQATPAEAGEGQNQGRQVGRLEAMQGCSREQVENRCGLTSYVAGSSGFFQGIP